MHTRILSIATLLTLCVALSALAVAPAPSTATAPGAPPARGRGGRGGGAGGGVPTRDPHTAGYPAAKDLEDGKLPGPTEDGNFVIGPTHTRAPEMTVGNDVPKGKRGSFEMISEDSKIYPGIAKVGTGTVDPADPAKLNVTTRPQVWTRRIQVYVPAGYVAGTEAPVLVTQDGDTGPFNPLDNLIAQKKVPPMVCIAIANGGNDAQGSQRGLEYDTMNGVYAEWVETEVIPQVERQFSVKITKDPEGRCAMGGSSGASCALAMAWYHNDLYHRVISYSGTFVNQQWPHDPKMPGGAWELHNSIIPNSPVKPIRIWMEVGDRDLLNPNVMRDNMHDWVEANERMAKVLADKGYHYQFLFAKNAGHVDGATKNQTLPLALEYVWQGYPIPK